MLFASWDESWLSITGLTKKRFFNCGRQMPFVVCSLLPRNSSVCRWPSLLASRPDTAVISLTGIVRRSLQWHHNERQAHDCLLRRLYMRRSEKTSKLRVTGLCDGNSPGTGEFPAQRASNAENVSIWWRHHVTCSSDIITFDLQHLQQVQVWTKYQRVTIEKKLTFGQAYAWRI